MCVGKWATKELRAVTRILKTGVVEPSLPKCGSPTIQKNIASSKIGVPAPKMGVQNCKAAVCESSGACDKIVNIILSISFNICFGCSKEPPN